MKWLLLTFRISFYCQNLHRNSQDKTELRVHFSTTTTYVEGVSKTYQVGFQQKQKCTCLYFFMCPRIQDATQIVARTCYCCWHALLTLPSITQSTLDRQQVRAKYAEIESVFVNILGLPSHCLPSVPPRPRNRAAGQTLMVGTRSFCQCSLWKGYRGFCDNFGRDVRESFRPGNV